MRKLVYGLLSTSILTASFAFSAVAQDGDDTEGARLLRMEQRIMALEKKVLGTMSDASGGTLLADHEARLAAIEAEASKIYGKSEEVANAIQKLAAKLDLIAKDMDLRVQDLEKSVAMGGVQAKEPAKKGADKAASPKKPASKAESATAVPDKISAEKLYDQAYDYMTKSRYSTAQTWFEAFLERHPNHDRADNAWYWLGEMHLVQDRAEDAVIAFSSGLKSFPTGAKAPDNMLKMGVAFERMGRKDLAKSTWEKLVKDFSTAASAAKAQKRLDGLK